MVRRCDVTTIKVKVARAHACATIDGYLTSGMVGVPCTFEYGPEWEGLRKTAVFTAQSLGLMSGASVSRDVLDADETVSVPAEVMDNPGARLHVGVYGWRDDGTIVIPTVMAFVGVILPGADPSGDPGTDPELPIWAQHETRIRKLEEGGVGGNGTPGFSPTVSVEEIEGGNRITITDVNGEKTVDVMDGKDGSTPVRGTDYWTDTDKAEIKSYVDSAILGGAW